VSEGAIAVVGSIVAVVASQANELMKRTNRFISQIFKTAVPQRARPARPATYVKAIHSVHFFPWDSLWKVGK